MVLSFKRVLLTALMFWCVSFAFAQATFITSGDWENSANWQSGDIGDAGDNVDLDPSRAALINSPSVYTIGDLVFGNGSSLAINVGGTLNVSQDLTANNTATISVAGILEIFGDLIVNTQLTFNITGTVIIHGNIVMNDGARMFATGNLTVGGNFAGGDDTDVTILGSGLIDVAGSVTVGVGSDLTGPPGSFHCGGPCNDGGSATFCNATMPIELLYFSASSEGDVVSLVWATESEDSFDHFEIERATQDLKFSTITLVPGAGYNTNTKQTYSYIDDNPYVGLNYYRLKAVDINGSFEYFNIVWASVEGEQTFEVYPNPVTNGTLNYKIDFNPTPVDQVSLVDIQGKEILSGKVESSGVNTINLQNINPGFYLLKYSSPSFQKIVKIIKH